MEPFADSLFSCDFKYKSYFKKLVAELKFALGSYSKSEIWRLLLLASKDSTLDTFTSKKKLVDNLTAFSVKTYKSVKVMSEKISKEVAEIGPSKYFNNIFDELKTVPGKIPAYIKNQKEKITVIKDQFLALSKDEQTEMIIQTILWLAIFSATSGGMDLEGGIPDMDLAFGIGNHRNIWEILIRFLVIILNDVHEKLPENHSGVWDTINRYIKQSEGIAISAMWAGISAHLLKDSNLLTAGNTKPYVGIPFSMSNASHKLLFAANGMAAGIYSYDLIQEHKKYAKEKFKPSKSLKNFEQSERKIIVNFGVWMSALSNDILKPYTQEQKRFVAAVKGLRKPETKYEKTWIKYLNE